MYLTLENWRVSGLKLKMSLHCFFSFGRHRVGGGVGMGMSKNAAWSSAQGVEAFT